MKKEVELAANVVRASTRWTCGQIGLEFNGDGFCIFQMEGSDFHATELIGTIASITHCYVTYDERLQKCVLQVF